jgi:hypothetical protein
MSLNHSGEIWRVATCALLCTLLVVCAAAQQGAVPGRVADPAADPGVVAAWSELAGNCKAQIPGDNYRKLAIMHTAMFDAVNSIENHYAPYKVKATAPTGASAEAAAVAAAHAALVQVCPGDKASLDAAYTGFLARIPNGSGKAAGIVIGEKVAAEIIALRAVDGAEAASKARPHMAAGVHVPAFESLGSRWGSVTPWVLNAASQFRPAPPPQLSSGEWTRDYNEVKDLGGKKSTLRTPEQTDIARLYSGRLPAIVVRQLAATPGRSLIENARLYALVFIASADVFIAVYDAKYTFNSWRPITAIANGDIDGSDRTEGDPDWEPLIGTPLDPEYPCGHCALAGAVGAVLQSEFGTGPVSIVIDVPGFFLRKWDSIQKVVDEDSAARIYGGVHFRTSTVVGQELGRKIGELAVRQYLKAVR